jgi:hypothetical protein
MLFISSTVLSGEYGANKKIPTLLKAPQPEKINTSSGSAFDQQNPQGLPGVFDETAPGINAELARPDYNDLPQPQFMMEILGEEVKIKNGGWGDGLAEAYFCSGWDEVNQYRIKRGLVRRSNALEANDETENNMGTYRLFRIVDRCKTEGCGGGIEIDNKCFVVALPKFATNCHPLYGRTAWDEEIFTDWSPPYITSTLDQYDYEGWQDRNYVDDSKGYLAGRIIVKKVDCIDLNKFNTRSYIAGLGVDLGQNDGPQDYNVMSQDHNFVEAPYSLQHQVWGFTCPEISKAKGYKENPKYNRRWANSGWDRELGVEAGRTYKKFLEIARDQLGKDIARNNYGRMYPNPFGTGYRQTATERETAEVVVNAWAILDWGINHIDWPCTSWFCLPNLNPFVRDDMSLMACRDMADASLVEYQDTENRLCIKPYVSHDCHSKRPMESNPHFNVFGTHPDGDGNCLLSYGRWGAGGIYERLYQQDKGRELYTYTSQPSGRTEVGERVARGLPADGYVAFMTARMAHQLCHAYFIREKGGAFMEDWPGPVSLWQEGLCNQTEALVHTNLLLLNYSPRNFDMKKTDFIRTVSHRREGDASSPVSATEAGVRFAYPHEYRGHDEIFLGSYLNNMTNIAKTLLAKKPQEARIMSILHAFVPVLDTPEMRTVNGVPSNFQFRPIEHTGPIFSPSNVPSPLKTIPFQIQGGK